MSLSLGKQVTKGLLHPEFYFTVQSDGLMNKFFDFLEDKWKYIFVT
jgi:hypothetical protein